MSVAGHQVCSLMGLFGCAVGLLGVDWTVGNFWWSTALGGVEVEGTAR
jgi:hypothetical protein